MGELWVQASTIVYRLYDVGYEIRLDEASALLVASAPERRQPSRGEAQAIQIANPPVTIGLGSASWPLGGESQELELTARLFDFGVVSIRARTPTERIRWSTFVTRGIAIARARPWDRFDAIRDELQRRVGPAIDRPGTSRVTEEYLVFRIDRLEDEAGAPAPVAALPDPDVARLLLAESRHVTDGARRELMSERFCYFDDDLTMLSWNAALIVEPRPEDTDLQYVLEFANAQLLELRYTDALLDHELPRINDEMAAARRTFHVLGRRYGRLLSALQTRVADATEAVERAENALKVTEDVFLARVYAAALVIFRAREWRAGIDRKVALIRQTYEMLNDESLARRTEILEVVIIVLIVIELFLALRRP